MENIIENVLQENSYYTKAFIDDCIKLIKSLTILSHIEANFYNEYIQMNYPDYIIDLYDKTKWRYYKHIVGEYHELDKPIVIKSIDNGQDIILNKTNMTLHKKTRLELLKFEKFYDEIVSIYPEQELLIKAIITDSIYTDIKEIIDLPNYTIIGYNSFLVENRENDIIYKLQIRLDNYKDLWLIPYYSNIDTLFIASQYTVLSHFLLKSLIAIRLENAKTVRAHSYHIKSYLSSHHRLDVYYDYLSEKQKLWLYRNLLYLDNHSGFEYIFHDLIENLLTERNISLVNYRIRQQIAFRKDDYSEYNFYQKLLNSIPLIYEKHGFTLDDIEEKEKFVALGNIKEYTYNKYMIDYRIKNMLYKNLLTKDLESSIIDNTDNVKKKLIPLIIDYWSYLLKYDKIDYLIELYVPIDDTILYLNTKDLYKLYLILLHRYYGIRLNTFPTYFIDMVFKPTLPTKEELLNYCYKVKWYYRDYLDDIFSSIPSISYIPTSTFFYNQLFTIYKLEIGLWFFLSNLDEKENNSQFELMIDKLRVKEEYIITDETVDEFLTRINLKDIVEHLDRDTIDKLLFNILDSLFDNQLSFLNMYKYIQEAMIEIFKKFKSYTLQFINYYYRNDAILSGLKDIRYDIRENIDNFLFIYNKYRLNIDTFKVVKTNEDLDVALSYDSHYRYKENRLIDLIPEIYIDNKILNYCNIDPYYRTVLDVNGYQEQEFTELYRFHFYFKSHYYYKDYIRVYFKTRIGWLNDRIYLNAPLNIQHRLLLDANSYNDQNSGKYYYNNRVNILSNVILTNQTQYVLTPNTQENLEFLLNNPI